MISPLAVKDGITSNLWRPLVITYIPLQTFVARRALPHRVAEKIERSRVGGRAALLVSVGVLAVSLTFSERADAFIPLPNPLPIETPTPVPPQAEIYGRSVLPAPTPGPGFPVGVSLAYSQRAEDLAISDLRFGGANLGSAKGHISTSAYVARLDAFLACSLGGDDNPAGYDCGDAGKLNDHAIVALNVSGIAGYTEGTSETRLPALGVAFSQHLGGPTLGVAGIVALATPYATWRLSPATVLRSRWITSTGVDFASTRFDQLEGWTGVYLVKPRVGITFDAGNVSEITIFGGAEWERFDGSQSGTMMGSTVVLDSQPRSPWSALLGGSYRNVLATAGISGFDLVAEGLIGNRSGVNLSLRYEFDLLASGAQS